MKKIIIALGFLGLFAGSQTAVFAGYFNPTPVNTCNIQITRTLQVGSENNDVYILQGLLSRAGYLYATPNGYFGPSTKAAVKSFQRDNYISATGIVGESTRNAINERLCDYDVNANSYSYSTNSYSSNNYGYSNTGTTYVDLYDPYVQVISPSYTSNTVYSTPQSNSVYSTSVASNSYYSTGYQSYSNDVIVPASSQVQSTNIIYSPTIGYTYGIVPQSGSLTITSPVANATYSEGDTVYLNWTTSNLNASRFQVLLENTSTKQSKLVTTTSGNSSSIVLTKELLDAVCAGACDNNQQGSFKIVIATPVTDIAGNTSMFRAAISPLTIKRQLSFSSVVIVTSSNSPVNSGEAFKLYVNTPSISSLDIKIRESITVKIRATCVNNVQVSIAGVPCGQDFSIPLSVLASQSGIPTKITNTTFYKQDVIFDVVITNLLGQIIGTASTKVIANPAPFSF